MEIGVEVLPVKQLVMSFDTRYTRGRQNRDVKLSFNIP